MRKTIRLGLVGFGTVGQGVAKILESNRRAIEQKVGAAVEIAGVCDLRKVPLKKVRSTTRYQDLVNAPDIDVIIELIGGYEPARSLILDALRAGKHVVTANKAVLAKYWDELFTEARARGRLVYFEASVGGGIPVIDALNEGLAANRIEKISGILNGTTNFILSEMTSRKVSFESALKRAQAAGFAEADPTFDIEGIDTAHKLAVLASLGWSSWIRLEDIATCGIRDVTEEDVYFAKEEFGYVIKLIGAARMHRGSLELSVQPCLIPSTHPFATVEREYNAIFVHGDAVGDVMLYGKGAGQLAAASAVVSDIISLGQQIASGTAGKVPHVTYDPERKPRILPVDRSEASYYLRFMAADQPGVLSKVSGILGRCGVSIASVYQKEPLAHPRRGVPILMLTHSARYGDLMKALQQIDRLPMIRSGAVKFRIEN